MDKLTIEVDARTIYDSLKNLESKMEEMIGHQKHTNGSVQENIKCIRENSKKISTLERYKVKTAAFMGGVVAAVQVGLHFLNIG